MKTLRVAIVADYKEEGWPSMDLVAEMLAKYLPRVQDPDITVKVELVCPPMKMRFSSHSEPLENGPFARKARNADRFLNRFFDYPQYLRKMRNSFDLFHLADHSYSQMAHELPEGRVVVSCHDVDTFRCLWEKDRRSFLFRTMVRRILSGFKKAAHVCCVSETTRKAVLEQKLMPAERCSVVLNGLTEYPVRAPVSTSGNSDVYILHVGSTIPRKRIDFLLKVFHAIQTEVAPKAKLIRVGGAFNEAQQALVQRLGIGPSIEVMPFLPAQELAIVYSEAALLLLTSDAEGFGFPIIEALSHGTPVLASDLPVLREVGGNAARFAPLDDISAWVTSAKELLDARKSPQFPNRQLQFKERAAQFSWPKAASDMVKIYKKLLP